MQLSSIEIRTLLKNHCENTFTPAAVDRLIAFADELKIALHRENTSTNACAGRP